MAARSAGRHAPDLLTSGRSGLPRQRRISPRFGKALVLAAVLGCAVAGTTLAQIAPGCAPGQAPRFGPGMSQLRDRLGDTIGTPIGCERAGGSTGETVVQTTTGTVTVRSDLATATFSDGRVHYTLADGRLTRWQGDTDELPALSQPEADYLSTTGPQRERLARLFT